MSDEVLRAAERRWAATGALEDEAAFLLERVRAGGLERERLDLTAYCEHPASILATGHGRFEAEGELDCEAWLHGLTSWGREVVTLAAVLVAKIVLRERQIRLAPEEGDVMAEATPTAVEEWIACPCQAHLERALHAGTSAVRGTPLEDAAWCAAAAASMSTGPMLLARVSRRLETPTPVVVAEVRAGLVGWALGRDSSE